MTRSAPPASVYCRSHHSVRTRSLNLRHWHPSKSQRTTGEFCFRVHQLELEGAERIHLWELVACTLCVVVGRPQELLPDIACDRACAKRVWMASPSQVGLLPGLFRRAESLASSPFLTAAELSCQLLHQSCSLLPSRIQLQAMRQRNQQCRIGNSKPS